MIRVKICGLTNLADARYCAAAGADYVGFVQHPSSPRFVTAADARDIIEWLHGPEPVGVFQDAPLDDVLSAVETAGFRLVQLHGDEPPHYCASIPVPVIKTFSVTPSTTADELAASMRPYAGIAAHVLLDSRVGALRGGTGTPFDWTIAAELSQSRPVFLAGGLGPGNAAEAASLVRPFAIDVASGVESAPGWKDYERITALFEALAPFRDDA